jgi:hypothetical protein
VQIAYRANGSGVGGWAILADEAVAALGARISGYQPKFSQSPAEEPGFGAPCIGVYDNGNGKWTLSFLVERFHATPDAALAFIAATPGFIGIGNLDLKITVGAQVNFLVNCAVTEFTPEPHSDVNTRIRHGFTGGIYTSTNQP